MNCPVCKRELAPTLSICLTCGAMMNDTVREELETKIVRPTLPQMTRAEIPKFEPIKPWTPQPVKIELNPPMPPAALQQPPLIIPEPAPAPGPEPIQFSMPVQAAPKPSKPKATTSKLQKQTSPTLVDFQPANPTIPDWRLQLQNSVRKRNLVPGPVQAVSTMTPSAATDQSATITAASPDRPSAAPIIQNEKVANAIRRIEASKRTFGSGAAVGIAAAAQARAKKPAVQARSFPFDVVERRTDPEAPRSHAVPAQEIPKPKLVASPQTPEKKFDTNKLPPIPEPEMPLDPAESTEISDAATEIQTRIRFERLRIFNNDGSEETEEIAPEIHEEIDDLAPLPMRFGAAVFDLIIGSFAAGILLSPILLTAGTLGTTASLLGVFGAWLLVMFAYFTGSIVVMGRTFGMKLFSIEMIDAEANELPTVHQAAVHSAVYLLSLLLFGVGFVPAFFNEERRAMHDLLAGTLLIREY